MAQKKITDLQLRSDFDITCNLPLDDTSQSWRVTGAQVLTFIQSVLQPSLNAQTSNYSVLSTDRVVTQDATSGARTLTLPTAVGISGRQFVLKKIDSSVNTVQLLTTSSQTIDGNASGALYLATQYESVTLVSNGANWLIQDHKCDTGWVSYTPTLSAGWGTATNISFHWRRLGDSLHVKGTFTSGTIAASLGTFTLPTAAPTINSSKICISNTSANPGEQVGWWNQTTSMSVGALVTATGTSTTLVYLAGEIDSVTAKLTPTNVTSGTNNGANNATSISFTVPIANWFA